MGFDYELLSLTQYQGFAATKTSTYGVFSDFRLSIHTRLIIAHQRTLGYFSRLDTPFQHTGYPFTMKTPDEGKPKHKAYHDLVVRNTIKDPGRYPGGSTKDLEQYPGSIKGLYLQVTATAKLWRLKYKLDGKEGLYSIGKFPDIGCAEARKIAKWAFEQVDKGIHPLKAKKAELEAGALQQQAEAEAQKQKEANTFRKVAEQWLEFSSNLAPKTLAGHRGALKNHLYPVVGDMPVADIKYSHVKDARDRLVGYPTAARYAVSLLRSVLDYAKEEELVENNVAAGRSRSLKKHKTQHHVAIIDPDGMTEFLRRLDAHRDCTDGWLSALRLLVLVPARPSEMASMLWEDVDLDNGTWMYVVPKTNKPHIALLPRQAVDLLRSLRERRAPNKSGKGVSGCVFPSTGRAGRPISSDTVLIRLRRALGYDLGSISLHGFRSSFRALAHEQLDIDPIVLELMLSHRMPGALGETYARVQLMKQRRDAAQRYADYLDELRAGAVKSGAGVEVE